MLEGSKFTRTFLLAMTGLCPVIASAFHDGDLVYGGVTGQIKIVIPTDMLENPPAKTFNYIPPDMGDPSLFLRDVGFDWFDLPESEYGIAHIATAKIISPFVSPGLIVQDNRWTYFTDGADRQSYTFQGNGRHKHFQFITYNMLLAKTYEFKFQLTEAMDIHGNPLADSPIYSVYFTSPIGQTVNPTTMSVTRGVHQSGTLQDLLESDNQYVVIQQRPPFLVSDPHAQLTVETTAPVANPKVIQFHLEASSNALPQSAVVQKIELFNFTSNNWEMVDTRNITSSDSVVEVATGTNANRFVQAGTLKMVARIGWFDNGTLFPNWVSRTDRVFWQILP